MDERLQLYDHFKYVARQQVINIAAFWQENVVLSKRPCMEMYCLSDALTCLILYCLCRMQTVIIIYEG